MGLDMYLTADFYVGGQHKHNQVAGTVAIEKNNDIYDIPINIVKSITIHVGYWHNVSAIHRWFVKNIQKERDDCERHDVSRNDLEQLQQDCIDVLDDHSKAHKLMPPGNTTFFGSTEIDNQYFDDLKDTLVIISKALALPETFDLFYSSSW